MSLRPRTLIAVVVLVQAAGCATMPGSRQDALQVELNARPAVTSAPPASPAINDEKPITIKKEDKAHSTAKSEIERGSGRFINEDAARAPLRAVKGGEGQITLNFESMPIQAAVQQVTDTWGPRVDILVNSAAWYWGLLEAMAMATCRHRSIRQPQRSW